MFCLAQKASLLLAAMATISPLLAIEPDKDFSGKWILDPASSDTRAISAPPESVLTIVMQDTAVQCTSIPPHGAAVQWTFSLDGADTRYRIGEENRSSKVKWEGSALLVNTIVSGPQSYSFLDRWTLSRDHAVLSIEREQHIAESQSEGVLRYRRESLPAPRTASVAPTASAAAINANPSAPALLPSPAPASSTQVIVRAGTRIPLSLRNAIDTKHSHEGDRVYLDTLYPVVVDNRIVIPRGSYVSGTLTTSKPAGVVKGKGELYIRFDSMILPNGTTRDFRSRLASADTTHGTVDRQEGTITGERDKTGEAKTTAEGAGIGAGIGGLAGAAAGHPLTGVGVGAAAGAAVGLASVLTRHRADVTLPRGTTVEMLLDRDLYYLPSELSSR